MELGPYTHDEWVTILQQTNRKEASPRRLKYDHLSTKRLRASIVEGLEASGVEGMRGEIWKLICRSQTQRGQYSSDVYQKFLQEEHPMIDHKIQKDIGRTAPGNKEFCSDHRTGKNRLYNVLKAYTSYDPEIGYCQGMNFLTAVLLQYIEDEEDAFWSLVFIMFERGWRDIFN